MHHSTLSPQPSRSEEAIYGAYLIHDIFIFYGIGIFFALTRILVRCAITRRLGLEEALMVVIGACYTGYIVSVRFYLKNGTNLMTPNERLVVLLSSELITERIMGSKALLVAWFLYVTVIWGCKTVIWMLCKRLTDRAATQKKRVRYTGFLLGFTYAVALLTLLTVCHPFPKYWQINPDPGRECTDGYHVLLIIGSLNILSDIPLLAIPLPIVLKLQINWRQKTLLFILFGVGICAIAAAIGRMLEVSINEPSGPSTFWALVETTCALFVSNVPGVVLPLLPFILPALQADSSPPQQIQSAFTFLLEYRRNARIARNQEIELRTRAAQGHGPQGLRREFSDHSLMGSEEHGTGVSAKTVTIMTAPLGGELVPEWTVEMEEVEEVEEVEGLEEGEVNVRVRSFLGEEEEEEEEEDEEDEEEV